MENRKPCIAIIGAGAIGGLFAAEAVSSGFDVRLCVRTPLSSFSLLSKDQHLTLPVRIETDPSCQSFADWVVLTTKVRDSENAAPWLSSLLGPNSCLIVAQNGIDQEERLAPLAKGCPILPALIYVAIERIAPGVIRHHHSKACDLPDTKEAHRFAALLKGDWLDIAFKPDFEDALWRKLMTNLIANSLTTLTLRRIEVMREPLILELARGLLQEAVAVGQAYGIAVDEKDVDATLKRFSNPHKTAGSSMYYDRIIGAPLEHDSLTGALLRRAQAKSIPTPLNQAIYALLDGLDKGRLIS